MNCLSVFDHLMKLGLDGSIGIIKISTSVILHTVLQIFNFRIDFHLLDSVPYGPTAFSLNFDWETMT